jgi:hypothetical protein
MADGATTLNLDKNTFGKAPAALYLTMLLNERGDRRLLRKVARTIESHREALNDIVCCHLHTDEMKTATFSKLLFMLDQRIREAVTHINDEHIAHLIVNILVGDIKTQKTRCMKAARLQANVARHTPAGETVPMLKATPARGEPTIDERLATLQEKSRAYLARKGKTNTLY